MKKNTPKVLLLLEGEPENNKLESILCDVQLLFSNQRGENKIEEGSVKQPPSGRRIKSQA